MICLQIVKIVQCMLSPTFTYGHSNSEIKEPALEKTAT